MSLLLDTSVLLKFAGVGSPLPAEFSSLVRDSEIVLSAVSRIEIAIKVGAGKLPLIWRDGAVSDEFFWNESVRRLQARVLAIEPAHVEPLAALPPIHRDPFDRLLISQGKTLNLPIATTDGSFRRYGVSVYDLDSFASLEARGEPT